MEYLFSLQSLREMSPQWITYFFIFISEIIVKGGFIVVGGIYWSVSKKVGATIFLTYSGAYTVNQLIKNTACVYRPWILDNRLHVESKILSTATGYSFPSGHTVTAGTIFGSIGTWFKENKKLLISSFVIVFLVAFSRNWLGAHTMKDVVVAILESSVLIIVSLYLSAFIEKNPNKDILFCIIAFIISIVFLLFTYFKSYPIHYDTLGNIIVDPALMKIDCFSATGITFGAFLGWILERRFVKFSTDVSKKNKILRFVFGSISFLILYFGLSFVFSFMHVYLSHLIKYFILIFYAMFIYPLIFTKFEKR